uniref:Uncharacterized protein n=1 Tax=Eutreptiella gymnastica TaxID=73025 RepID=A0A7S4LQ58_9EUGL
MGNFLCGAEISGPYEFQVRPMHVSDVPDNKVTKIKVKMEEQHAESSEDVTFERCGSDRRMQRWGLEEPVMKFKGKDFQKDTMDIEVVGLDERPAIPLSRLSLQKDELVMRNICVGKHQLKLMMTLVQAEKNVA